MKFLLAIPLLALAACGTAEPESAANKAARVEQEIVDRAAALNMQVENELSQTEQRLDREASDALNSLNAAAASANSADEAPAAAASGNKAR